MFIQYLISEEPGLRQIYLFVVVTVVISIVLHELAHGWMAIRRGDDTPLHTGHMTGNPLVHMGPFSIVALILCGIAWGQMPIDPTRLRGKYAEALVAAAGPATNILLAVAALTGLGLWLRLAPGVEAETAGNARAFLMVFGATNLLLCIFNLMPVPPLDGSHILANFHHGYALFISNPAKQQIFLIGFMFVFFISGKLLLACYKLAGFYVDLLVGG